MPKDFPATLDDFLRRIVKAETPADSMKRLRDFFRSEQAKNPELYRDPVERIAELKARDKEARDKEGGCFPDLQNWSSTADAYWAWWRKQISEKRSKAGKKKTKKTLFS